MEPIYILEAAIKKKSSLVWHFIRLHVRFGHVGRVHRHSQDAHAKCTAQFAVKYLPGRKGSLTIWAPRTKNEKHMYATLVLSEPQLVPIKGRDTEEWKV